MNKEFDKLGRELEEQDKKLRHEPVTLYCLGCGKIISENFTGGLWDYTHQCNWENIDKKPVLCRVFGSKERGAMLPSSLVAGYKSHARCKECKTEKEHTEKVLKGLMGKNYNKCFEDKDLQKLKAEAIILIMKYCSEDYGKGVDDYIKLGESEQ